MESVKIENEKNITEAIEMVKNNTLLLDNINKVAIVDNIQFPYQNIFREHYRPLLIGYCQLVEMTPKVAEYYKYKPKLFCRNLYGSPDVYHLILWLNNMTSFLEFNKSKVIALNPKYMDILESIVEKESFNLENNRNNPYKAMK